MRYRESKKKMGKYDMCKSHVSKTYTEDWALKDAQPMSQEDNGSMNYKSRKDSLAMSDSKKLKSSMLSQM